MSIDTGVTSSSDIDIVNRALIKLGQGMIDAFDDETDTARAASALYYHNRNMLLRKIPWNFARKWAALAQLAAAPLNLDIITPADRGTGQVNFGFAYQLPNDCLRVHRFSPKDMVWRVIGRTIYTAAQPITSVPGPLLGLQPSSDPSNGPVTAATTSQIPVGIEYIMMVQDPTVFDELFIEALTNKMAMDMAFGQNGLEQIVANSKKDYQDIMLEAAYVNGVEQLPDSLFDTTIVDVRMGYGNTGIDFAGG
jgi:hypothetical protein